MPSPRPLTTGFASDCACFCPFRVFVCGSSCSGLVCTVRAESLSAVVIVVPCLSVAEVRSHFHAERLASPTPLVALDPSTLLWTMPTSNHQRQQRRATARRAAVATDDVPDAVPRPKGRGPRNHFWDPRPPGVRRHNESNEPNQRIAARLASARGRHADAVRGRRWSRINAARCNEAKSFQAPASSASWRGLHGPSRRPGGR